jgi:hypothetical protein
MGAVKALYMYKSEITDYDTTHGSAFDRGSADSYYNRGRNPHKGGSGGTMGWNEIKDLTPAEVEAYNAGYDWNEHFGDKKDWC